MAEKEKDVRKIKTPDGSIVRYSLDNKMHYWSGPAYIPQGNMKEIMLKPTIEHLFV